LEFVSVWIEDADMKQSDNLALEDHHSQTTFI
jgi:hypothetical protein